MTAGSGRGAMRQGRRLVNAFLERMGLRLSRIGGNVSDCRGVAGDALEAAYRAAGAPFVFDFALAECRIIPAAGFACVAGANNPFVDTLTGYCEGSIGAYEGSPLERYHTNWQPRNAAEVLGLAGDGIAPLLQSTPPLGFVMPWSGLDPATALAYWQGVVRADHREHGETTDPSHGWKAWGPVGLEVGRLEFRRLVSVCKSIRTRGYQRNNGDDGDIGGVLLCRDDGCRVLVTKGHHRAAALAALGHGHAPIRVEPGHLIRRGEMQSWPNVRSGLFTPAQALEIFDRLYDGRQQPQYRWDG